MKEVKLSTVGRAVDKEGHVLELQEVEGERMLILGIGASEAVSIARAVQGFAVPRPMTHDLLVSVISRLGGSLQRVLIHEIRGETVIGQLDIETDVGMVEVDARPSDCIALAVRQDTPVYVAELVLQAAGVTQDMIDEQEEDIE